MVTPEHAALIAELEAKANASWGAQALLACLQKLRDGGPTEASIVEVCKAAPLVDGFTIDYLSPWGPRVGLVARRGQLRDFAGVYQADADTLTPAEFGDEIADFFVGEPLGTYSDRLKYDEAGLGWWGDDSA